MAHQIRSLLLVLALLGSTALLRANPAPPHPSLTRGPMVQLTTRTSAILTWRTSGPTIPLVRYGLTPDNLTELVLPVQMTIRVSPDVATPPDLPRLHSAPPNTYQHEAYLGGLAADTIYYYGIFDDEELLAGCTLDHFIRTQPAPVPGRPLRFWVTGDSGTGTKTQLDSFHAMLDFIGDDQRPLDAFLHLGDMAYQSGRDAEFQLNFFDIYATLLRNTVTWPTMGNHEGYTSNGDSAVGPYFDAYVLPRAAEAGGFPSGTEAYYSFDLGPIHFVCLNSYDTDRSQAAAMGTWLQQDLTQNQSEWLIAFWHHPPYSKGTHNSDTEDELIEMREQMVPLLEDHGVDLILTGHSHVYERSMLIDGAYDTPTIFARDFALDDGDGHPAGDGPYRKSAHLHPHQGMVAVVAGNGAKARRFGLSSVMRVSLPEIGSVLLDLEDDTLTVRMINTLGAIRDEFQIIKRGEANPREPLSDPWSPYGPYFFAANRQPGITELHCEANPAAADAVIHYTLDGSEPTTDSPVYREPILLTQDTVVKAFSIWRSGTRTSPVSIATVLIPVPSGPRTLRIPVLTAEDDASESDLGVVRIDKPSVGTDSLAGESLFGVRFRNIPVPPGATILSSSIQFTATAPGLEPATWTIHGDLSPGRAPFAETTGNLSQRARTTRSLGWQVPTWPLYGHRTTLHRSPDLSPVIQEVLDEASWSAGDSLAFLFSGTGSREAFSHESIPRHGAELTLVFDERDPLTLASEITPTVELDTDPLGNRKLHLVYPSLGAASALGLTYQVEGSSTLEPGSWQPLTAILDALLPGAPPFMLLGRYRLDLPGGLDPGDRYFLRISVTRN